jgi:nucleoside-triphosphatase
MRLLFVTGHPGIGKTTVILNATDELRKRGYRLGGMVTREVREKGTRIGFQILDVDKGQKGWLARTNQSMGPQVGKYRVNLTDLDQIGVRAIRDALETADLVVIDEIGPMELFSSRFKQAVRDVLDSNKAALGVIHHKTRESLIDSIRKRSDSEIIEVTTANRDSLHNVIIQRLLDFQEEKRRTKTDTHEG